MPSFRADPKRHGCRSENVVAIDFARKIVLIGGSYYAGEMKKSVFTTLNYYLPAKGVLPMHCSANVGPRATPRSSSACPAPARPRCRPIPNRTLIGDDEHGWGNDGVFNFEGGCYAKCIKLSQEAEPQIFAASQPLRRRARERACSTKTPACLISTTARRPKTPVRPIRSTSSRTLRAPAAPASRRTS
jgi:phosphoenolpyruvate carboxykinase (ATP)